MWRSQKGCSIAKYGAWALTADCEVWLGNEQVIRKTKIPVWACSFSHVGLFSAGLLLGVKILGGVCRALSSSILTLTQGSGPKCGRQKKPQSRKKLNNQAANLLTAQVPPPFLAMGSTRLWLSKHSISSKAEGVVEHREAPCAASCHIIEETKCVNQCWWHTGAWQDWCRITETLDKLCLCMVAVCVQCSVVSKWLPWDVMGAFKN